MKIGFLQFAPVLGDLRATMHRIDSLLQENMEGCDLLVLPELCNSGYNFQSYEQAWETSEPIEDSIFVRYLINKCRERNLHVVSGFNERDRDTLYNSAILVGPHGLIGTYRKLHLFLNEKDFFRPGNQGVPVFDIGSCIIGMLICFDWTFPEAWRIAALKGADIICHPSNLVLPGLAQRGVPIHALLNRLYIVTANRIGAERDLSFTGSSIIANPRGDLLCQASPIKAEVGIAEIDIGLARDKQITDRNDLFKDRRPEEYSLLTEPNPFGRGSGRTGHGK
ncbi:MAG: carbon-nitrogen hydrolase [Deltaproteobacteria bacterium]|nr:carbon-nitrogen hydrolase [Deltaproteobacteria bacterium]